MSTEREYQKVIYMLIGALKMTEGSGMQDDVIAKAEEMVNRVQNKTPSDSFKRDVSKLLARHAENSGGMAVYEELSSLLRQHGGY